MAPESARTSQDEGTLMTCCDCSQGCGKTAVGHVRVHKLLPIYCIFRVLINHLFGYNKIHPVANIYRSTVFPKLFARGPLLASENNHESSHLYSRKYSVRIVGTEN